MNSNPTKHENSEYIIKAGSTEFKNLISEEDEQDKINNGFKEGQEDIRELVSNIGFFGARNIAVVTVPKTVFNPEAPKSENNRAVVMDFVKSEGTLQDLMMYKYLAVNQNLINNLLKRMGPPQTSFL